MQTKQVGTSAGPGQLFKSSVRTLLTHIYDGKFATGLPNCSEDSLNKQDKSDEQR